MKNARPENIEAGAPGKVASIFVGSLPTRKDTVVAEVLCRLLAGEHMTSLDGVREASTTRLSAVVWHLEESFRWGIARRDKAAGCKDGRVAWVSEYFLTPETQAAAQARGVATWCREVRAARRALRLKAAVAARRASRLNALARRGLAINPAQRLLWDGEQGGAA